MPVSSLPLICAETVLIDHGKIYISDHIASVCARLGISVQPGRPYTPTDKAAVERFFRTLREELLAALPGYKGPDIHSRGHRVEDQAFYFRHELEDIIRRWIVEVYHQRPHSGLVDEQIPGVCYTPMQRLEAGIARAGFLRIPGSPNLALDFLPVEWRTVQHYGVEIDGLRYNGSALDYVRNATSPHGGTKRGKWPFRVDPNNRQQIFFYNEDSGSWHALDWNGRESIPQPFSSEVYRYATRIAASTHKIPDSRRALRELLERWEAGVVSNPIERRMWLRLSAETEQQLPDELTAVLPSDATPGNAVEDPLLVVSDDDMVEELLDDSGDDGDFYGDAYELGE